MEKLFSSFCFTLFVFLGSTGLIRYIIVQARMRKHFKKTRFDKGIEKSSERNNLSDEIEKNHISIVFFEEVEFGFS